VLGVVPLVGGLLTDIFKTFTGVMQTAVGAMTGFAQQMLPFVQQLSPSTVENFNYQMRGLQATIGVAFNGFVSVMADTISKIAGILMPVMQELSPLFTELGGTLRSLLLPVFRVIAAALQTVIPVIKTAFGTLRDATGWVVKSFVSLVAIIGKLFGIDSFVDKLKANFTKAATGPGATPAGPASLSNFEQIGKDMAVAAAQASVSTAAGTDAKSERDLMADIVKALDEIKTDTIEGLITRLGEMILNFWELLKNQWETTSAAVMGWVERQAEPIIKAGVDAALRELEAWAAARWPTAGGFAVGALQGTGNLLTGGLANRAGEGLGNLIAGALGYD